MSQQEQSILKTYEKNERYLNADFLNTIEWDQVTKHELDESFLPVLVYMRDVEAFTDIYYQELLKTPTGKDPIIRQFMDRWQEEEQLHADLLNRFLGEAGYPTSDKWYEEARQQIPNGVRARLNNGMKKLVTSCAGKRFSAVHMTWGAINELSTLQGYKRLWQKAQHPVLEHILRGIAREESSHIFFYHSIARIKLQESPFAQRLARTLVERFWAPVGTGLKTEPESNLVIRTLFQGENGIDAVRTHINGTLQKLPGFDGTTRVTDRISQALRPDTQVA